MSLSEILTIGDELLRGEKTNTNSVWLAKFLSEKGAKVLKITTIRDEVHQISKEIMRMLSDEPEIVITTGGLGPTLDDRTLEALTRALDKKLVLHKKALSMIKKSYSQLKAKDKVKKEKLTPPRRKMAKIPEGSEPVPNPIGTAPAVFAKEKKTKILYLPGIPKEMKSTIKANFEKLKLSKEESKSSKFFDVAGRGESSISPLLEDIEKKFQTSEVSSYPYIEGKGPKVRVRLTDREDNLKKVENYFKKLIKDLEGARIEE